MTKSLEKTEKQPSQIEQFKQSMAPRLADVATEHLTPERLLRLYGVAAANDKKLAMCSVKSLAASLLLCSQLGLEPASPLGHVYLVPYGTDCTPIIGYKGMLELIRRTGEVKRINANVFYTQQLENGDFYASMEPPEIRHRWSGETYPEEDIAGSYCVVEGMSGEFYVAICSRAEIDKRRQKSAARNSGPWETDFEPMARKCAIRKLFGGGTVPISAEKMALVSRAMEDDGDSAGRAVSTRAVRAIRMFEPEPEPPAIETTAELVEPETDWAVEWRRELENYQATEEDAAKALKAAILKGPPETEHDFNAAVSALESVLGA
jgi:recombination protein RecT